MQLTHILTAAAFILATGTALPALADNDKHERHRHHHRHSDRDYDRDYDRKHDKRRHADRREAYCPPGLVQVRDICVPRGQAKKYQHQFRVGDRLRGGNYYRINDPRQYQLQQNPNWSYYRDNNSIYRVDEKTQTIMTVMNLIQAFSGR